MGCGGADADSESPPKREPSTPRADSGSVAEITPLRCPTDPANCAAATGTVLTLERVDPDGDGDAHLVLLSPQGITAPGISVIDVRRSLRPNPLPDPGDLVAAAGPVYTGSYGQRQIQATELRLARR